VLKKAGILVGVAAAGVLALTPFAFADNDHHESSDVTTYSNVEEGNLANDCEFGQAGALVDQNLVGGDSLLAAAGAVTGAVAPADTQTQLGNCTNINLSDVVDSGSNNETTTREVTEVDGSFNESTTLGG
jgi:outer membrane lipoprotein SlyB